MPSRRARLGLRWLRSWREFVASGSDLIPSNYLRISTAPGPMPYASTGAGYP